MTVPTKEQREEWRSNDAKYGPDLAECADAIDDLEARLAQAEAKLAGIPAALKVLIAERSSLAVRLESATNATLREMLTQRIASINEAIAGLEK